MPLDSGLSYILKSGKFQDITFTFCSKKKKERERERKMAQEERENNGHENGWVEEEENDPNQKNKRNLRAEEEEVLSVERYFETLEVPSWRQQLTVRAFVVSFVLSILFCFIVMKLNLTAGIIPSLNVSAGLLGYFFVRIWTQLLSKAGFLKQPFTRQENTVIQTCVVASSGIAFSGMALFFFFFGFHCCCCLIWISELYFCFWKQLSMLYFFGFCRVVLQNPINHFFFFASPNMINRRSKLV